MTPFATVAQYDARFPGRAVSDEVLTECLTDASYVIADALDREGIDWEDPSEDLEYRMMSVCRSMANRIVPSNSDIPIGATQMSMTAGPYQQSYSISSTYGTPKLLSSEYGMLGIPKARIACVAYGESSD